MSLTVPKGSVAPSDPNKQPVLIPGTNIKMLNGQSLLGSGNLQINDIATDIVLDFGPVFTQSKSISVADARASTTSRISIHVHPNSDEYEMDPLVCYGYCAVSGIITFIISSHNFVAGERNFFYFIH